MGFRLRRTIVGGTKGFTGWAPTPVASVTGALNPGTPAFRSETPFGSQPVFVSTKSKARSRKSSRSRSGNTNRTRRA